jgi:hypothetical protein
MGCLLKVEFVEDSGRIVESRFTLSEAFIEFNAHEYQRNLDPFGVSAVAVRRSGYVWIVNVLLGKVLTLSCKRSFRPHTTRGHAF